MFIWNLIQTCPFFLASKIFGCLAFVTILKVLRIQFDSRARKSIFLVITLVQKAKSFMTYNAIVDLSQEISSFMKHVSPFNLFH